MTVEACRRLVWSSPPSSSKDAVSPTSPATTERHSPGYRGWSPGTDSRAGRPSSRARDARTPVRPDYPTPRSASSSNSAPNCPAKASTTARRPSPGTYATTTQPPCRRHRSADTYTPPASSNPHHANDPRAPTSASPPNNAGERWQADFTHWSLADQTHVEILDWLDDHSRYAISVTAHIRVTGPIVGDEFRKATAAHGIPYSTLTDNGMVFTTRLAGGKGGRNALEAELHHLGVIQINSTPNHPTTCGKIERFHQTLKRWLARQPRAHTIAELQTQLDAFVDEYNHRRPHCSLPHKATPYTARPKAAPGQRLDPPTRAHRPRRRLRHPHPARRRPPAPHQHRPRPRPNPRSHARPRPRRQNHRRRHRRAHPPPHHRPHQGLPTPRSPLRTPTNKALNLQRGFRAIRMSCNITWSR